MNDTISALEQRFPGCTTAVKEGISLMYQRFPLMGELLASIGLGVLNLIEGRYAASAEAQLLPEQLRDKVMENAFKNRFALTGQGAMNALLRAMEFDLLEGHRVPPQPRADLLFSSLQQSDAPKAILTLIEYQAGLTAVELPVDIATLKPPPNWTTQIRQNLIKDLTQDLRRGVQPSDMLAAQVKDISRAAELGDCDFFVSLGEMLIRHKKGKIALKFEPWLEGLWIPLALWGLATPDIILRIKAHRDLLLRHNLKAPDFPNDQTLAKQIERFRIRIR